MKELMGRRAHGTGGLIKIKGCRFWYLQYYSHDGKQVRESSRTEDYAMAEQALLARLNELGILLVVTPAQRFWNKVNKNGPMPENCSTEAGPCWFWKGSTSRGGYGQFRMDGKTVLATHVSWFFEHGVWPTKHLLHACDTPPCVNPKHLFEGDAEDNAYDRDLKAMGAKLVAF